MDKITTAIILDSRRPLKDGTYPIKLRVTYQRKQKHFGTIFNLSKEDYEKVYGARPREEFKKIQLVLSALEEKARKIIGKMSVFTFDAFERKFYNTSIEDDVFSGFDRKIEQLKSEGRVGTASSYECASLSLLSFLHNQPPSRNKGLSREEANTKKNTLLSKRKPLSFSAITVDFLNKYESWMKDNGLKSTTVGIYLRPLRAIFKEAIDTSEVNQEIYPFSKRKYQIPAGRNVKKALNREELKKIFNYEAIHDGEAKARDYWWFSFQCNGMNVKDMARLKYKDIDGDIITFIRAKTERTSRQNQKPIVVAMPIESQEIIQRWGNKPVVSDSYVFPIISPGLTPEQELSKVRQATKFINQYMKRIALAVGIDKNLSTYVARHSFSTTMKRSGASIEEISEAVGHQNVKTTESYLDSFEVERKRQYAGFLTGFKDK